MRVKLYLPAMKAATVAPVLSKRETNRPVKAFADLDDEPVHLVRGVPFGGPFGGRDREGEYFHVGTNIFAKVGDEVLVTYAHGINPDFTLQDPVQVIGAAKIDRLDDTGYWFAVKYDRDTAFGALLANTPPAQLKASSGATLHLTRIRDDGRIDDWWLSELAIFLETAKMKPANDYAIVVPYKARLYAGVDVNAQAAKAEEDSAAALDDTPQSQVLADDVLQASQTQPTGTKQLETNLPQGSFPNKGGKTMDENITQHQQDAAQPQPSAETPTEAPIETGATRQPTAAKAVAGATTEALQAQAQPQPTDAPSQTSPSVPVPPVAQPAAKTARPTPAPVNAGAMRGSARRDDSAAIKAFDILMNTGNRAAAKAFDQTAASGVLPPTYQRQLIEKIAEESIFDRYNLGTRRTQRTNLAYWPTLTHSAEAPIVQPSNAYGDDEPTTGLLEARLYKFAPMVRIPEEVVNDYQGSVWSDIIMPDIALRFAKARDHWFVIGDGADKPYGVFQAQTAVTTVSNSAISADEIIDLYFSLKGEYRNRPSVYWMMNDATLAHIRKLKDSNGQYLLQPGIREDGTELLMGKPVITTSYAPLIAADTKVIVLGDFSFFWIFEHPQTTARRLMEHFATIGQVAYVASRRWTSRIMLEEAFVALKMAA